MDEQGAGPFTQFAMFERSTAILRSFAYSLAPELVRNNASNSFSLDWIGWD